MKKIVLIISGIILAGALLGYLIFFRNGKEELNLKEISRETVVREVSETGAVEISEKINTGFKSSGRLEKINVEVGDVVQKGEIIASLNPDQLEIELAEARANLDVVRADYAKLLAGSSGEEIQVALIAVANAEKALNNAKQNLADIENSAEEDMDQSYENAIDDMEDAKLKAYNAMNVANEVRLNYFTVADQESYAVSESCENIEESYSRIILFLAKAQNGSDKDVGDGLSRVRSILLDISDSLNIIRNIAESIKYRNTISGSYKTSLDNHKSYVNTARNNIISAQQDISGTKLSNEKNINSSKASVDSSESSLNTAKYQLILIEAGPTEENKTLYLAKINQAQAQVLLLENRLQDSYLRSPVEGQVIEVNKKAGEVIQPTDYIVSILPSGPFQVKADIYEEDIVEIKEGNSVKISLPAFPDRNFSGRIISVNPAEKLTDGVVYYEVTIAFEETTEGIKPGMTADIIIETAKKENVLAVPRGSVKKENGKTMVRIYENNMQKNREVELGLIGEDYTEIISGLSEGDKIILD